MSAAVERLSENGLLDPDAIVRIDEATLANLIKPVSARHAHHSRVNTMCKLFLSRSNDYFTECTQKMNELSSVGIKKIGLWGEETPEH